MAARANQISKVPLGEGEVDQQAFPAAHPVVLPQFQKPPGQPFLNITIGKVSQSAKQHMPVPGKLAVCFQGYLRMLPDQCDGRIAGGKLATALPMATADTICVSMSNAP